MKYFFYGNFQTKLNEKISELVAKNQATKIEFNLEIENLNEIFVALGTSNLFGDTNIIVANISEAEPELIENFFKNISGENDLIVYYSDELEKSSKILKLIPKDFTLQEFKKSKTGNIFNFTDYLLSKDMNKTYSELAKLDEDGVLIFNNIIPIVRNLISLKKDLNQKNKIIPFKVGLYKKMVEKYTEEELLDLYKNLYQNDLKFKSGEITNEMLVLHTVNSFFIKQNGSNK